MGLMISPVYVALDSSILIKLASDAVSNDKIRKDRATAFLDEMRKELVLPLLADEHVTELLGHENDEVVRQRAVFLERLEPVAWLADPAGPEFLGGAAHAALSWEVIAVHEAGAQCVRDVVGFVNSRIRYTASSGALAKIPTEMWVFLAHKARERQRRAREAASIGHAEPPPEAEASFRKVMQGNARLVDDEDIEKLLERYLARTIEQLTVRGDPRITNIPRVAAEFVAELPQDVSMIIKNRHNLLATFEAFGITADMMTPNMTFEDLRHLAVFLQDLRIVSEGLGLSRPLTVKDVAQDLCPSWLIRRGLSEARRQAPRGCGSDLLDVSLAALAPYVDVLVVDKRTHEFLEQVLDRQPTLRDLTGIVCKVQEYTEVIGLAAKARRNRPN